MKQWYARLGFLGTMALGCGVPEAKVPAAKATLQAPAECRVEPGKPKFCQPERQLGMYVVGLPVGHGWKVGEWVRFGPDHGYAGGVGAVQEVGVDTARVNMVVQDSDTSLEGGPVERFEFSRSAWYKVSYDRFFFPIEADVPFTQWSSGPDLPQWDLQKSIYTLWLPSHDRPLVYGSDLSMLQQKVTQYFKLGPMSAAPKNLPSFALVRTSDDSRPNRQLIEQINVPAKSDWVRAHVRSVAAKPKTIIVLNSPPQRASIARQLTDRLKEQTKDIPFIRVVIEPEASMVEDRFSCVIGWTHVCGLSDCIRPQYVSESCMSPVNVLPLKEATKLELEGWTAAILGPILIDARFGGSALPYMDRVVEHRLFEGEHHQRAIVFRALALFGDGQFAAGREQLKALFHSMDSEKRRPPSAVLASGIGRIIQAYEVDARRAYGIGRSEEALQRYKQLLESPFFQGHQDHQPFVLKGRAEIFEEMGEIEKAREEYSKALRIGQAVKNESAQWGALAELGRLDLLQGRTQANSTFLKEIVAALDSNDDDLRKGKSALINPLFELYLRRGQQQEACIIFHKAISDIWWFESEALKAQFAKWLLKQGRIQQARDLYKTVLRTAGHTDALRGLAWISALQTPPDLAEARYLAKQSLEESRRSGSVSLKQQIEALYILGKIEVIALKQKDPSASLENARNYFLGSLDLAQRIRYVEGQISANIDLALLDALYAHNPRAARSRLLETLKSANAIGFPERKADVLRALATVEESAGQPEQARNYRLEVKALYQQLNSPSLIAEIKTLLGEAPTPPAIENPLPDRPEADYCQWPLAPDLKALLLPKKLEQPNPKPSPPASSPPSPQAPPAAPPSP